MTRTCSPRIGWERAASKASFEEIAGGSAILKIAERSPRLLKNTGSAPPWSGQARGTRWHGNEMDDFVWQPGGRRQTHRARRPKIYLKYYKRFPTNNKCLSKFYLSRASGCCTLKLGVQGHAHCILMMMISSSVITITPRVQ